MTSNFLQTELASLIQESKKKSPETRTAAEKSLADLKGLSITSEAQITGDLRRKQHFIDPFIFACKSRNVKLAGSGIICLQRLAAGRAIPRERLSDVLEALRETASLNLDIQLKILQTLPSLLQLYTDDLKGNLLAVALEVCDTLQASKTSVVSSTAAATFQQLVTTVYERVTAEDGTPTEDVGMSVEVENLRERLRPAAHDTFRILKDLCLLASNTPPKFVQLKALSPQFLLEVIGSILTNYGSVFTDHPEQVELCRSTLMPALNSLLNPKTNFAITVRVLRIVYVLLKEHIEEMQAECETTLSKMIALLEPNAAQPWKRVLCMELFRGICSDASLLRVLFRLYDEHDDRSNIVSTLMGAFVRIASEDPSLIGLGRQSTMPSRQSDSQSDENITSFEVSDIGGTFGGVMSASTTVTGLSMEWSTIKAPYLEQFDKSSVSDVPTTYVYSLVLNCISAFAEGLSRFVMPLSVPGRGQGKRLSTGAVEPAELATEESAENREQKRPTTPGGQKQQRLINPLILEKHPQAAAVKSCARMIETCWPPLLATCSTFFNAALDSEFYHNLVRAFQKITQVSGILELSTARDALLTSLSKAAVPATVTARVASSSRPVDNSEELDSDEPSVAQTLSSAAPNQSVEFLRQKLTTRNLLCLRALLNLGIALGPTLGQDAWFIIIDALQRAEALMNSARPTMSSNGSQSEETQTEPGGMRTIFGVETAAVHTASQKMLQSTSTYSDDTFRILILALFRLDPMDRHEQDDQSAPLQSPTGLSLTTPTRSRGHRAARSISAAWVNSEGHDEEHRFMISKLAELIRSNLYRFISPDSFGCSWDLIVRKLLYIFESRQASFANRLQCASTMDLTALEVVKLLRHSKESSSHASFVRAQCFKALSAQLDALTEQEISTHTDQNLKLEIHARLLETLENILGQCGDTLTEWEIVLKLISSAFIIKDHLGDTEDLRNIRPRSRAGSVLQKSFASLQLIISDFLSMLPSKSFAELIRVLFLFGSQDQDLNISLTTTTFFWTVASALLKPVEELSEITRNTTGSASGGTWMLMFSQLVQLTVDSRAEVRQSSIRMLLRIFEASGPNLSSISWNTCLRTLFLRNLQAMEILQSEESENHIQVQDSAIQVLAGTVQLAASNIDVIAEDSTFTDTCSQYLEVCRKMLEWNSLAVSEGVFASLAKFLKAITSSRFSKPYLGTPVLQLWYNHHPADIDTSKSMSQEKRPESNQAAFSQYALALLEILYSRGESPSDGIDSPREMMEAVYKTILNCVHPAYTSDVQKMSPEQDAVALALPMLNNISSQNEYISFIVSFVKAPLSKPDSASKSPSFIALSRRCIELLRGTVIAPAATKLNEENPQQESQLDVLPVVLQVLADLMSTKYTTLPQGADPPLWQIATSSGVDIIKHAIRSQSRRNLSPLLPTITAVASSILSCGGLTPITSSNTTPTSVSKDADPFPDAHEKFDTAAFTRIHTIITPALKLASEIQMKEYILILFHASLVALPFMFDLPKGKDLTYNPLIGFSTVRPGTALDPVFAPRKAVCYTALEALFGFVARPGEGEGDGTEDGGTEGESALAAIAAPYVLLRCGYTFKSFIADQPLRSLTPLPKPLRVELREVLWMCLQLSSLDAAFTQPAFGVVVGSEKSKHGKGKGLEIRDGKGHLRLLNGLMGRLERCWRGAVRVPARTGRNWQEVGEGVQIQAEFEMWRGALAEGWGRGLE